MTKCKNYRDYIYVEDLGRHNKIALEKKIEDGIYNLGSSSCLTIKNFIISFCKEIKFDKKF